MIESLMLGTLPDTSWRRRLTLRWMVTLRPEDKAALVKTAPRSSANATKSERAVLHFQRLQYPQPKNDNNNNVSLPLLRLLRNYFMKFVYPEMLYIARNAD